jgi:hypothetical protein
VVAFDFLRLGGRRSAFWARLEAMAIEMGERQYCVGTAEGRGKSLDKYRVVIEISEIKG